MCQNDTIGGETFFKAIATIYTNTKPQKEVIESTLTRRSTQQHPAPTRTDESTKVNYVWMECKYIPM